MKSVKKSKLISSTDIDKFNERLQNYIDECNAEGLLVVVSRPQHEVLGNYSGGGKTYVVTRSLVVGYEN